jgi:hypothetical protein
MAADCRVWKLPEKFNAIEDTGFFVVFSLKKKSEGQYSGTAHYNDWNANRDVKGRATARLDGPKLDITAQWVTTATGGGYYTYYNGSISGGSISGLRKDPRLRESDKNREVFWKSKQKATCAVTTQSSRPWRPRPWRDHRAGT